MTCCLTSQALHLVKLIQVVLPRITLFIFTVFHDTKHFHDRNSLYLELYYICIHCNLVKLCNWLCWNWEISQATAVARLETSYINSVAVSLLTQFLLYELLPSYLYDLTWVCAGRRHLTDTAQHQRKLLQLFTYFFFLSNWQHAELEAPFNKWSTKPQSFGSRSLKEGPKALFWNSFFSVQCSPWTSTRRGSSCLVSFSYFLALKMKMISYKDFFQMRVFD